jgi:hypothetical protein
MMMIKLKKKRRWLAGQRGRITHGAAMCCATGPQPSWSPPRPSAPTATAHSSPSPWCLRAGTTTRPGKEEPDSKITDRAQTEPCPARRTHPWTPPAAPARASRKGWPPLPPPATTFSRPAASLVESQEADWNVPSSLPDSRLPRAHRNGLVASARRLRQRRSRKRKILHSAPLFTDEPPFRQPPHSLCRFGCTGSCICTQAGVGPHASARWVPREAAGAGARQPGAVGPGRIDSTEPAVRT